jgi:hypothetical protein
LIRNLQAEPVSMSGPPNIDPQSSLAWELDVSQLGGNVPAVGERQFIRLSCRNQRIEIAPAETFDSATHQIIHVRGEPFVSHLSERDAVISRVPLHQGYWEFAESFLLLTRMERGTQIATTRYSFSSKPLATIPNPHRPRTSSIS